MQLKSLVLLAGAAILSPLVQAQTWTACNPLNGTCPVNPALGTSHDFVFNTSSVVNNYFNITSGSLKYGSEKGAEFTIAKQGQSPTIQSKFYIFFGKVSVIMQAATGQGIVSSIVLESDDLDEVDWEMLGTNTTHAESNYFGKGNTTAYDRAGWHPISDPTTNFHNYTIEWTAEKIDWIIDGNLVRTLKYNDALDGKNFPQTPMNLRLGIWSGGDPKGNSAGTIEWAQGETDFTQVPFTMYVKNTQIEDYSTGAAYNWTDTSGSWESIKSIAGNSTTAEAIIKNATPDLTTSEKWNKLSSGTKLAVYCGAGAFAAVCASAFLFFFFRQRRNGRQEREAYNQLIEKQQQDAYKDQMELHQKGGGGWSDSQFVPGSPDSAYVGPSGSTSASMQGGNGARSTFETAPLSNSMSADYSHQQPTSSRFGAGGSGGAYAKF